MPRSKRAKVVHLSKVQKKGKELTLKTFANVQSAATQYQYAYVFAVDNMRNQPLKDVRTQLADSRLFFGKTKVMARALGSSPETEPAGGTHRLTPHLRGNVGILFSPRPPEEIIAYFSAFRPADFARAGTTASRTFILPPGIVLSCGGEIAAEDDVPVSHTVEPTLRQLGVPSRLEKGKVMLDVEYTVCKEGEVLGSAQTALLKMFGVASAEFRVELRAVWAAESGSVDVLSEHTEGTGDGMDVDDGDGIDEDSEE